MRVLAEDNPVIAADVGGVVERVDGEVVGPAKTVTEAWRVANPSGSTSPCST